MSDPNADRLPASAGCRKKQECGLEHLQKVLELKRTVTQIVKDDRSLTHIVLKRIVGTRRNAIIIPETFQQLLGVIRLSRPAFSADKNNFDLPIRILVS